MKSYLGPLIALLVAVILALIMIMVSAEGQPVPPLQHSVYDHRLDRLDRAGVEAAYRSRVALLFTNWMTDTGPESQNRALRGHRNARDIYIKVMTGLDLKDPEGTVGKLPPPLPPP